MRVSTVSGNLRVTTTKGFLGFGILYLAPLIAGFSDGNSDPDPGRFLAIPGRGKTAQLPLFCQAFRPL
jgi:hypothetical protein